MPPSVRYQLYRDMLPYLHTPLVAAGILALIVRALHLTGLLRFLLRSLTTVLLAIALAIVILGLALSMLYI